ncbi:MAG: heavy metal translocating P-type ATPase, partial [Planctomycetota bacterium]
MTACAHCGLPVPPGLLRADREEQFCCAGCEAVWAAIRGCGLERYYAVRERVEAPGQPARVTGRSYDALDDPAFHELYVTSLPDGQATAELYVEGVHCAACMWLIERLPQIVPGVSEVRLDLPRRLARVVWDPQRQRLSTVAAGLDRFGYPAHPSRGRSSRDLRRAEDRRSLVRIGVAGAIAGNVMVIAFALYGGMFHGMETSYYTLFRYSSLALTLLAIAWPGRTFFQGALAALRTHTGHMDLPIALGLAAGTIWSAVNTVRGTGEVYFESLTMLIFLLLVGRWVQQRQQRSSYDAVEQLYALTPSTARRLEDGAVREVPLESVMPDDLVEVRAGDSVPADGSVVEGASRLDLSLLTGESRPVAANAGDLVHAGTVNLSERIVVRVAATGQATRVGRLMRLVEQSAASRAPVVRLADRLAGWFVLVVLALAGATALVWWSIDPARALPNALSLLIVTCPCALGLATPLAIMAGIGQAARRGILVKGGETIEGLGRSGLILFDKTGTLTRGEVALVRWEGPAALGPLVAAAERHSAHPVARAFVAAFPADLDRAGPDLNAQVTEVTGGGITARVDGRELRVGSRPFLETAGVSIDGRWAEIESELVASALSPVFVAEAGALVAVAGFGDPVDDAARDTVAALARSGWSIGLLSGDHPAVAAAVAAQIGIEPQLVWGGVDPERKLALVR